MLVKCETKSGRVKGMSFHPKLSWIVLSLHNGTIQLWDFRIGSLIDKFDDHKGPVRGVHFHSTQPLFVSGGDDATIKVWNYHQRRCIFTLCGHFDYIRVVQFHNNYPWILSASDDQTVRIWNWQSRNCIAVLTGHNHYVMRAQFHPTEDLLVSASLDQTIRVWDVRGLREKTVAISNGAPNQQLHHVDMFGTSDATCKFVLEGHDRGINCVCFHSRFPFIASAADDRLIKIWRYDKGSAWELETLRGHVNNVSSVAFHPNLEVLISNSEDRTIRIWDYIQRTVLHTYRRDSDRFWALSVHPLSNLIAVGHDSGMVVFKMNRERPAFCLNENMLYYIKRNELVYHNLDNGLEGMIVACKEPPTLISSGPIEISLNLQNPSELNALIVYKDDVKCYNLIVGDNPATPASKRQGIRPLSGTGLSFAFISRMRFAVLETPSTMGIYNMNNEIGKRLDLPCAVEKIFAASHNKLLLKYEEMVGLYDITSKKILCEAFCPGGARTVVWSADKNQLALISKHNIVLTDNRLEKCRIFHENIRVKGGAFDENGAFIFATLNHVKYCLPSGDQGILLSLVDPIYIIKMHQQQLTYINRSGGVHKMMLNCEEYLVKCALQRGQLSNVAHVIKSGHVFGNSLISYLKKNGYADVAMQFVKDPATRFNLALEHGDITEATKCATTLNDKSKWNLVAKAAYYQGDHHSAEMAYRKVKNYDKLSFLYLITGNLVKLGKMLTIAEAREDVMSRYQNAILLGNAEECVRVLAEVGQIPLAFLVARVHQLTSFSSKLGEFVKNMEIEDIIPENPKLLVPPLPIYRTFELNRWPLEAAAKNKFESAMELADEWPVDNSNKMLLKGEPKLDSSFDERGGLGFDMEDTMKEGDAWGELHEIMDFKPTVEGDITNDEEKFDESKEKTLQSLWLSDERPVADYVAAGEFSLALSTLRTQIGLMNAEPLKPHFNKIFQSTWTTLPGLPFSEPMLLPLLSKGSLAAGNSEPIRVFTVASILTAIKSANKLMIGGNFSESLSAYVQILQTLPLAVPSSSSEVGQLEELKAFCRDHVTVMRLECTRKGLPQSDIVRNLELVCYLASYPLQASHKILTLRRAMIVCFKAGNYLTASFFAQRLIQQNGVGTARWQEETEKAKHTIAQCKKMGKNTYKIQFDQNDYEALNLCTASLTLLAASEATVTCPFCLSKSKSCYSGSLCVTCELSEMGAMGLGFTFDSKLLHKDMLDSSPMNAGFDKRYGEAPQF